MAGYPKRPVGASQVRDDEGRKECSVCREWRSESGYDRASRQPDGYQGSCKVCRRSLYERNRVAIGDRNRLKRFGLSAEAVQAMLEAQGGKCATCQKGNGGRTWHVDHDHACCAGKATCGKCVRGLLCNGCNVSLGHLKDDVATLQRMIDYLDDWSGRHERR